MITVYLIKHRLVAVFTALLLCVLSIGAAPGETSPPPAEVPEKSDVGAVRVSDSLAREGLVALAHWDLAGADEVAERLERKGRGDTPDALLFKSRLAFFHGDYARCLEIINQLESKTKTGDPDRIAERVKKLAEVMKNAKSFESEHFIIRIVPGPDEILVADALKTLERAYEVLTHDLEVKPTMKVVAEVFPDFESFGLATGLSEENVETTGTVAVCKFSRLIITTPRALLRGYQWRDTVSHEFVHYLIFLRAGYNCPIWLHEGIAKYEEKRWRMPEGGWMAPTSQSLLAAALKADNLITFGEMEPSFAMLPSARAGQLAFAEVTMCVRYLVHRGGFKLVLRLLDRLDKNPDWRKAIKAELGEPYGTFLAKWKKFMRESGLVELEGVNLLGVKIRKRDQDEDEEEEESSEEIEGDNPAGRYTRLGNLLRAQGRPKAALIEYRKALDASPNSVFLLNKTAHLLMMQGEFDAAWPLLEKAEKLYPEAFPATFKRLGTIYLAKENWEKAREYFEKSTDINPFDPEVHYRLIKVYSNLGLEERKKETERKRAILTRTYAEGGEAR